MEKKCSKCGKPFNPEDKSIKTVDTDGNPLRIDLCSMCELDNTVEEVAELKHISRKEAEKYFFDKINEMINDIKPYNNEDTVEYMDYWNSKAINVSERPDGIIRMVKDNE